jgi:heptaprenyl diphosphate synthase
MTKARMETKTITTLGILTAVALVLGYVEHLIPITTIPGIKLGLANTVLLYALYLLDIRSAVILMVLKVGLSGFLFGGVTAMMYSFAGGVLSLAAMLLIKRLPGVSIIGVSALGAVMHNIGQLLVASLIVETRAVMIYLPVLLVSAVVTGILTGVVAKYAIKGLRPGTDGKNKKEVPLEEEK